MVIFSALANENFLFAQCDGDEPLGWQMNIKSGQQIEPITTPKGDNSSS